MALSQDAIRKLTAAGRGLGKTAFALSKPGIIKTIMDIPVHNKIGLGLGITSLGVSTAGYRNNQARIELDKQRTNLDLARTELDQESLNALQKIHKALMKKPVIIVKTGV